MHYNLRQVRVALLLVAGLLALGAIYVRAANVLPLEPYYVVRAAFQSEVIADVVSIHVVQSVVESPEFQRIAGSNLSLYRSASDPRIFHLASQDVTQERAEKGVERATELLRIKLRSLALAEVEASKSYLSELEDEVRQSSRGRQRSALLSQTDPSPPESIFSSQDRERAALLKKEIAGVEDFLRYRKRPDWLRVRLDGNVLRSSERAAENAELELSRLREMFTPQNKTVAIQAKIVQKRQNELLRMERHLSKALLNSHRSELQGLEKRAQSVMNLQEKLQPAPVPESDPEDKVNVDWLTKHSQKLSEQEKVLESKATLHQMLDPVAELIRPLGYWLYIGLWVGALCVLVGALFLQSGPSKPRDAQVSTFSRVDQSLESLIERQIGDLSGALLILGQNGGARAALSLRLARRLASQRGVLRLVDFDFQNRPLSELLTDPGLPGVSDVLSRGGVAEEFFASLPGSRIQFASAGTLRALDASVVEAGIGRIVNRQSHSLTVVDASFSSPIGSLHEYIDAVICLCEPGVSWDSVQSSVLDQFKAQDIPVLGVALDGLGGARLL